MTMFAKSALAVAVCLAFTASAAIAQPGRGPGRGQGGGGSELDLLRSEGVQKELELVDDQISQIQKLGEESRNAMRQAFQGVDFRNLSEDERNALRDKVRAAGEESQEKIRKVLLPHQRDRLSQIHLQSRLRGGTGRALGDEQLRETLGISEDQVEKLREKSEEINKELNEKIAKLREEARQELLESVLTKRQIADFEKMIGETFDFPQSQQGGRPGAGPGGRGQGQGARGQGGRGQGGRGRPDAE